MNPPLPASAPRSSYLIVGLGNPGREYQGNRHNIGFMVINRLVERLGLIDSAGTGQGPKARPRFLTTQVWRLESKALVAKADFLGNRVVLAKPQTFMNLSGRAVKSLARFYKITPENMLVIYDEVDLPSGAMRLRPAGSSGGHHGMDSIIAELGAQGFPRLRIGIGRPPGLMEAAAYVLQDFTPGESERLPALLDRAAEAVLTFVSEGLEKAMNHYNAPTNDQ